MRENIENNPTDSATKRPNSPFLKKSDSHFILIKLDDFEYEITLPNHISPDDPISLFILYYTPELIKKIVQYTNQY
jgi:hypothetical protein